MADELEQIYLRLNELIAAGKSDEAKEYLTNHMPILPQELQDEILTKLFMQSVIEEAEEIEMMDELQEEAVETGETLLKALKDIKAGEGEAAAQSES